MSVVVVYFLSIWLISGYNSVRRFTVALIFLILNCIFLIMLFYICHHFLYFLFHVNFLVLHLLEEQTLDGWFLGWNLVFRGELNLVVLLLSNFHYFTRWKHYLGVFFFKLGISYLSWRLICCHCSLALGQYAADARVLHDIRHASHLGFNLLSLNFLLLLCFAYNFITVLIVPELGHLVVHLVLGELLNGLVIVEDFVLSLLGLINSRNHLPNSMHSNRIIDEGFDLPEHFNQQVLVKIQSLNQSLAVWINKLVSLKLIQHFRKNSARYH